MKSATSWKMLLMIINLTILFAGSIANAGTNPPLIPRQILFGDPDKSQPQISPDGTKIGYLAQVNSVLNIWVMPVNQPQHAKPITNDTNRGIRKFFWAYTNHHILYLQDQSGDENWHVYCVDLTSGAVRDLTPYEHIQANMQEVSYLFPKEILVGINQRDPKLHDIYRINLETGASSVIFQNDKYGGLMTDENYQVRLGKFYTPDGGSAFDTFAPNGKVRSSLRIGQEDALTTTPVDFDKSGQTMYLLDSRGRDTAALTALDLVTGKQTVIASDPCADISGTVIHPTKKTIQAYMVNYERAEWHPLDKSMARDFKVLRSASEGDPFIVSRTLDDSAWVVGYTRDNGPLCYYLYDRNTKHANYLFSNQPELEKLTLPHMQPVIIQARDGLELVSYLTLPMGAAKNHKYQPGQPLPMVLWIHGGPWYRDFWGYNPAHQWLANRGYAVLSINYRGSTGFGKNFTNAANREWGGKMHDDIIDAVNWAIRSGIADPKKVAIVGGSYGGYEALIGMTRSSELFACGVDIVGPSNLATFINNLPGFLQPLLELFRNRVGDTTTEVGRAFLLERSPLTHVGKITKPLLIAQGANDPRVPRAESDQIVRAMQSKGIPVTYLIFSDEGHGFVRPENNIAFRAATEAFLAQHLGGSYQAIGDDFKGSSIEVITGAEHVPGLSQSLRH